MNARILDEADGDGNEVFPAGEANLSGPGPRKVALGLDRYLQDFAARHSAETWRHFAGHDPTAWKATFLRVMRDPGTVALFNLRGVNTWKGVARAAAGLGGPTDWELFTIRGNEDWWPRILWLVDDDPAPNPFE